MGDYRDQLRLSKLNADPINRVIITTRLKGKAKERFINDSIKRDIELSKLAECIFKIHYAIVSEYPALAEFDYTDVRGMDSEKLRECVVKVMSAK